MKECVKWFDNLPWIVKIIFALPGLDIVWAVYRIIKGAAQGKVGLIVAGILWIILGWALLWLIDLICVLIYKKPTLFA
ncbi:MAG: hypothetical protein IKC49_02620 [Clostridia bacterium]|nr:hypothetical protein [Clostridia bacterium]